MNWEPTMLARLLVLSTTVVCVGTAVAGQRDAPRPVECDVHQGSCTARIGQCEVTLDIAPKPVKAMKDLTFRITLTGNKPSAPPYIDLGMPGMEMGPNRVQLSPTGKGAYEGNGIIVRCPSGRRTWNATVSLPDIGKLEFIFDVIY